MEGVASVEGGGEVPLNRGPPVTAKFFCVTD